MKLAKLGSRVATLDTTRGLRPLAELRPTGSHRLRGATGVRQRDRIKVRDRCICKACGKITIDGEADHQIPLCEGGSNDDSNMAWLCRPCHARKSAAENARRQGYAMR